MNTRNPLSILAPIDRCKIVTDLELDAALFDSADAADEAFKKADHSWYHFNSSHSSHSSGRKETGSLQLLHFSGITLFYKKLFSSWYLTSFEFNPGGILYGHTGRNLDLCDFTLALTILRQQIAPLLKSPSEAWKLIPGTAGRGMNPSYWSSIEIPLNFHDADGSRWHALSNMSYPKVKKGLAYNGETMTIGKRRSKLIICLYRRDLKFETMHRTAPQSQEKEQVSRG